MDITALEVTIARLEAKPGDTVVITTARPLTSAQAAAIKEFAQRALPEGVKAMVMMDGLEVSHVVAAGGGGSKL